MDQQSNTFAGMHIVGTWSNACFLRMILLGKSEER